MPDDYPPLLPNQTYHVLNHANGFENVFANEGNYTYFLEKYIQHIYPIAQTFAYCLLPNHFHLLIQIRSEGELEKRFLELKREGRPTLSGFRTLIALEENELPAILSKQFSNLFNGYTQAFNRQ